MNYDIESLPHLVSNALAMSLRASFTPSDSFKGPHREARRPMQASARANRAICSPSEKRFALTALSP